MYGLLQGNDTSNLSVQFEPNGRSPGDNHVSYPRPSVYKTKPCRFYAKGRCTAGEACRWSHDDDAVFEDESDKVIEDPEIVPDGYKLVHKSYRS
jgi:hypothetical protein